MTTTQPIPNLTPEQTAEQARILREGSARDAYQFARDHAGALGSLNPDALNSQGPQL